ncbi:histone-lysine N-methyltransferase NSD2-like isoform X3 [Anopheles coustani]|uniref:histone-lysine N-methyltransferase NSD2-like isoform X3 n=1 Tax=Anopheles coustani TaxID=139045 RepID=UPI00265AB7F2|nr:histone-lysine N-methyltransferase NSD2-like isoform X3 [Anopheles coustani]
MHLDCTTAQGPTVHERGFKCSECKAMKDSFEKQSCFVCNDEREETKTESKNRCIYNLCARQYHITCLCMFPQYKARRPICIDSYCDCRPDDADPCGPTSLCINRITMIECIPSTCPAKDRCLNQRFAKRHYQSLEVRDFEEKGHGLVASESITYGKFIIEYVGEVIDRNELNRRVKENRQNTNYFLRIDHLMTIDAGQKGNVSRFINHSCNPNCKMQKWNVGYAPAIGLFATKDIKAGEELTVNYNSKYFASMKQECRCGSSKCSGYIK